MLDCPMGVVGRIYSAYGKCIGSADYWETNFSNSALGTVRPIYQRLLLFGLYFQLQVSISTMEWLEVRD